MNYKKALDLCKHENIYYLPSELVGRPKIEDLQKFLDLPYDSLSIIAPLPDGSYSIVDVVQHSPSDISISTNMISKKLALGFLVLNFRLDMRITDQGLGYKAVEIEASNSVDDETVKMLVSYITNVVVNLCLTLQKKETVISDKEAIYNIDKKLVKHKNRYRNRDIRFVSTKKYISNSPILKKVVNWTHSFSVSGHWRKVKGVGKNRVGEYCIDGATWVNPCIKNKELEFINKVAVIK